jgi:hypothetical protein
MQLAAIRSLVERMATNLDGTDSPIIRRRWPCAAVRQASGIGEISSAGSVSRAAAALIARVKPIQGSTSIETTITVDCEHRMCVINHRTWLPQGRAAVSA